jgi:hypothetical protein
VLAAGAAVETALSRFVFHPHKDGRA